MCRRPNTVLCVLRHSLAATAVLWLTAAAAPGQDVHHQRDPLSVTQSKIHKGVQQLIHLRFDNYEERNQFLDHFFPGRIPVFGDEFGNGLFGTPDNPQGYARVEIDWLKVTLVLDYARAVALSEPLFEAEAAAEARSAEESP